MFAVQGQYMPVHPDLFGQKWNLQFGITPVIPETDQRKYSRGLVSARVEQTIC
jgi:hypothetical protein